MKVKGGILVYLFVLIGIVLGVALILGAIMIISPGVEIFGLSYINANTRYNYVIDRSGFADFNNYDTIIVETDYSNITLRVGVQQTAQSCVYVNNHVNGFVRADENYSGRLSYSIDGTTLSFKLVEDKPWLTLTDSRTVEIRVNENTDISGVNFIFKSRYGSINLGGGVIEDEAPMEFVAASATLEAGGAISVGEVADVSGALSMKTTSGNIDVVGDKVASLVIFETESGRITADNLNSVRLSSNSGGARLGDVAGNFNYDSRSGVLEAGNVSGSFIATAKVKLANISLGEVSGEVGLSKGEDINFEADRIGGFARIVTQKGNVYIGNGTSGLGGQAEINVGAGDVRVLVEDQNASALEIATTSASITATFNGYAGNKTLTTESGQININLRYDSSLNLTLKSQGRAYLVYDDNRLIESPDETLEIRGGSSFSDNNVMIVSGNNNTININRQTAVSY